MKLQLSCSCGWKHNHDVAAHVLERYLELVRRAHPKPKHQLTVIEPKYLELAPPDTSKKKLFMVKGGTP
jgi:hypothetical protein